MIISSSSLDQPSSPSMAKPQFKLARIVSRHDEIKVSFDQLKSQINIGLLQAEDVFTSLDVPLTKLVGLKTAEMAEEGRSGRVLMNDLPSQAEDVFTYLAVPLTKLVGLKTAEMAEEGRSRRIFMNDLPSQDDYATTATMAGKELIQKQRLQFRQLMDLLKHVEGHVNSSQDTMFQTIDDHKASINTFYQKVITYVSTIITLKLLKAIYDHVHAVFNSVEDDVENLIYELAEEMRTPMIEYVKGVKVEMTSGTCPRLFAMLEEVVGAVRYGRLELEQARGMAKIAEKRKHEALRRLKESEESARTMKEHLGFYIKAKSESAEHFLKYKGDYAATATMDGKQKQRLQFRQLMDLLKHVEGYVNYSQDTMFQTIDDHKASINTFSQKAITYVSTIITLKLLKATYDHVHAVFNSVEGGVENLIHELAKEMCTPMMEYVKGVNVEMTSGICPRLFAMLEEVGGAVRNGRLELEQARGMAKALRRLKKSEELILTWTSHGSPPRSNLSQDELLHLQSSSSSELKDLRRTGRGKLGKNSSDPDKQVVCEQQYASIKKILKENKGKNLLLIKDRLADTFDVYFEGLQGVVETHVIRPRDGYFSHYQIIAYHEKWLMLRKDCIVVCYSMSGNGRFLELPNLPPPGIDCPPLEAAATFDFQNQGVFVLMWKTNELVKMLVHERGKTEWDVISLPTAEQEVFGEYFRDNEEAYISGLHMHKDGGMVVAICSRYHIFALNLDGTLKWPPIIPIFGRSFDLMIDAGLIKDNSSGSLFYVCFKEEVGGVPGEYLCSELELNNNEDMRCTTDITTFLLGRDLLMTEKTGFAVLCASPDRASTTHPYTREMVHGLKLFSADHYGEHRFDSDIYFLTEGGHAFRLGLFTTQQVHECTFAWISA